MTTTPAFLYGTAWKENDTERCVAEALKAGFRGIDTANQRKHYFEAGVGAALQVSQIPRAEVFLQTKYTFQRGQDERLPYNPQDSISRQVRQSFESSLQHLFTDYLDSYILHGPTGFGPSLANEDWEAWHEMEKLFQEGKAKSLGASNVNLLQLKELYNGALIKPQFVQIRCYARNRWDREMRDFCKEKKIVYQGFSLLTANRNILVNLEFLKIAARLKATPAQIVFTFARQVGMLPLTGTTDPIHMREDLASLSLTLSSDELQIIEQLGLE